MISTTRVAIYVRISTDKQDAENELHDLKSYRGFGREGALETLQHLRVLDSFGVRGAVIRKHFWIRLGR